MIKSKKINDIKIKKVRLPKLDEKKIRGSSLLPLYSNTFICAKKASGKTTVIYNILKKCADSDTILHLFVSTISKDRSYISLVKHFQNKGLTVHSHTSTVGENGQDLIRAIIDEPAEVSESESDNEESSEEDLHYIAIDSNEEPEENLKKKKRKKSKLAQKMIIVLDDLGNELKKPSIDMLVKINRHLKCKVILSSQYLNDLSPQARRQIDVWLLFGGLKKNKLEQILRDADTALEYNEFEQVYMYATSQKYNFMYLDTHTDTYRRNFNEVIQIG